MERPMPNAHADDAQYQAHLRQVQAVFAEALRIAEADTLVIDAGAPTDHFRDDQAPPFRANPYLLQWAPLVDQAEHVLVWRPGERPILFFYQPEDYWHAPAQPPAGAWTNHLEVRIVRDLAELQRQLAATISGRSVYLGARGDGFANLVHARNPAAALASIDFARATKTGYELDCLRRATSRAVAGHRAAAAAFAEGASEFAIHLAYLAASSQTERELPYGNIVALNEHAGVLHYQHQDRQPPVQRHSFLIDAGARADGYIADITRTYAAAPGRFADLVAGLDAAQQRLLGAIRIGMPYLELHERAHREVAALLCDAGVLRCRADQAFERGHTRAFLPHGLGHLLGLQTHDVGGHLADASGRRAPPPAHYPSLRNTRTIGPGQVFTIEPGIYFVPMLLAALRASAHAADVDWPSVETLLPCGGIRIEDNVHVLADGIENLTRDAFAASARLG